MTIVNSHFFIFFFKFSCDSLWALFRHRVLSLLYQHSFTDASFKWINPVLFSFGPKTVNWPLPAKIAITAYRYSVFARTLRPLLALVMLVIELGKARFYVELFNASLELFAFRGASLMPMESLFVHYAQGIICFLRLQSAMVMVAHLFTKIFIILHHLSTIQSSLEFTRWGCEIFSMLEFLFYLLAMNLLVLNYLLLSLKFLLLLLDKLTNAKTRISILIPLYDLLSHSWVSTS